LRTGLLKGRSPSCTIAAVLRKQHGLGLIRTHRWGIHWEGLEENEFAYLDAAQLTARLFTAKPIPVGQEQHVARQRAQITDRKPRGWMSYAHHITGKLDKGPDMHLNTTPELLALADQIERGEVTSFTLTINEMQTL